jgi:hypothetical protein
VAAALGPWRTGRKAHAPNSPELRSRNPTKRPAVGKPRARLARFSAPHFRR